MVPQQEFLPDLVAIVADLPQNAEGIDSGEGDDKQQTAEPGCQREAGTQYKAIKPAIQSHIRSGPALVYG
jgi:hypothetical protein